MSNNSRTVEIKEIDGNRYRLVKFNDKFVIYKCNKTNAKEAQFGQDIKQFSDENEAKKFFNKL